MLSQLTLRSLQQRMSNLLVDNYLVRDGFLFKTDVTYPIFHSLVKVDGSNDLVNIMYSGEHIWTATSFSTATGYRSGPEDLDEFI